MIFIIVLFPVLSNSEIKKRRLATVFYCDKNCIKKNGKQKSIRAVKNFFYAKNQEAWSAKIDQTPWFYYTSNPSINILQQTFDKLVRLHNQPAF